MRHMPRLHRFLRDEEGSEVVEYALVIALVSIVLAIAAGNSLSGLASTFQDLAVRLSDCFTSTAGTC